MRNSSINVKILGKEKILSNPLYIKTYIKVEDKDSITLEFFQVLSTKNIATCILVNVGVGMYEGALRREDNIFSLLL